MPITRGKLDDVSACALSDISVVFNNGLTPR